MLTFFLILHLLIALAMVGVILLQRSEGGGLGIGGGGGGGMDGLMSSRETANFLTRLTAILAVAFMASSILLALLVEDRRETRSIIDMPEQEEFQDDAALPPVDVPTTTVAPASATQAPVDQDVR